MVSLVDGCSKSELLGLALGRWCLFSMNARAVFAVPVFYFLVGIGGARGQLLYDNGPPDHMNGSEMTAWMEADDFVLSSDARVKGVKFWDFEISADFVGTIVWQIYTNQQGEPGTLLYTGSISSIAHTPTGIIAFGLREFVNTFEIPPADLPAGTYWLALHNGPLSNQVGDNVFWEATAQGDSLPSQGRSAPFTGRWFSNAFPGLPSDLAFQINGVPAPRISEFDLRSGKPRITFSTISGESYTVEYKNDLNAPAWTPLAGAELISGTGSDVAVVDADPSARDQKHRFYRARLL
ncbi:MAG: hypothetical protein M3Y86_08165 [Verrucomicrobiota bacterium]|nr:hypothetical protein [Verrucomicrobiota bacterium]